MKYSDGYSLNASDYLFHSVDGNDAWQLQFGFDTDYHKEYFGNTNREDIVKHIVSSFKTTSSSPTPITPTNTEELIILGQEAGDAGDWDLSLSYFEEVVRIDPFDWEGNASLGVSYQELGDYNNALHYLNLSYDYAPSENKSGIRDYIQTVEAESISQQSPVEIPTTESKILQYYQGDDVPIKGKFADARYDRVDVTVWDPLDEAIVSDTLSTDENGEYFAPLNTESSSYRHIGVYSIGVFFNDEQNWQEFEMVDSPKSLSSSGGGCLIATATYGSELAPQVQLLRELRDNSLLSTESGTNFMNTFNDFYYSFSPYIADYERENPVFREMVKIAITPMLSSLSLLNYVDMNSEAEVLGYGISLILLNVGMYVGIPAIVIVGIRKRF